MIHRLNGRDPDAARSLFVAWNAEVCGEVTLSEESSVWYSATVRGDIAPVSIGRGSNIQDNAVIHVDSDAPTRIGDQVTVGHGAIVHGATIGDRCIIGMGAIILSGAVIGADSMVGAGTLVTEGKSFPPGSLIIGSPGRVVRALAPEEVDRLGLNADHYIKAAREAREQHGPGV